MCSTHEPQVVGVEGHLPLPERTGHDVEVIQVVPRRCRNGVITARYEHALAAAYGKALVERAVFGVDALQREAALVPQAVVVRLLESRLGGRRVRVVLVRRVARPMPA